MLYLYYYFPLEIAFNLAHFPPLHFPHTNMKRGNYEGGPSPGAATAASKRHRGDKFEVRLLVPLLRPVLAAVFSALSFCASVLPL